MIPAKIAPFPIKTITGQGLDSVVDWFDQHQLSLYILGWSYLKSQQQMEELFYQSILKVHKELPKYKRDTSFETWLTSIFIHICRELAHDQSLSITEDTEPRQDLFIALDQLKEYEREAIVLKYVTGLSQEEVAQLLQISVEKLKELLFSGIQSLKKEIGLGSNFNGCEEYRKDYIAYLERAMERSKKIDFEVHIYHCQDCQEDLATFQEVMLSLINLNERNKDFHVPSGFMGNVKARLAEEEMHRQQKKKQRKRVGLVSASVFVLLIGIGFFTGVFSNLYYTWTEDDQQLRAFLQQNLGERLNLEAENEGVKIKIKSVIADDVRTLVFYEIEDRNENNQYVMNYDDGLLVENENEIMNRETFLMYSPPDLEADINKEKMNVFHGKISLRPLTVDNGTIRLKITNLQKLIRDSSDQNELRRGEKIEYKTGEWNFEIPVTKQTSAEYALDEETEVEGIPVRFDKLILAPTTTVLQYDILHSQPDKQTDFLNFDILEVNEKNLNADLYNGSFLESLQDSNWNSYLIHFDPLFGVKPKEVNIQFESVILSFQEQKTIELDASKEYPQIFEYAGSTISIDNVEVGQPSKVVISNHEIKNRVYQTIYFNILDEGENIPSSMEMHTEGVFVDKNGMEYDMNDRNFSYEEIDQPRYFDTVYSLSLQGNKVIPKSLVMNGYSTTKYLDDAVRITLE